MAREKVTIMAERAKLARVRELTGAASASDAVDIALDRLLRVEGLRADISAYHENPPSFDEVALAGFQPSALDLADDTDWEGLYADAD